MELFVKTVNSWKRLTIFAKSFILDLWLVYAYASYFYLYRLPRDFFSKQYSKKRIVCRILQKILSFMAAVNFKRYFVKQKSNNNQYIVNIILTGWRPLELLRTLIQIYLFDTWYLLHTKILYRVPIYFYFILCKKNAQYIPKKFLKLLLAII